MKEGFISFIILFIAIVGVRYVNVFENIWLEGIAVGLVAAGLSYILDKILRR